jgi:sugar O-acyltransferase (sialic acid O-acetyltransferase NeuD family)
MTRNMGSAAPVYIVGAGGLGREILDALFALGRTADELVLVDDHPSAVQIHGVPVRRPEEITGSGRYVVAVGDPAVRRTLSERLQGRGMLPTSVVHPRATLAHDVTVPDGCLILANAFVSTNVRLGAHTQVHYNATVGHDSMMHEFVTVLPGANVAGTVVLHPDVTVGSNACVLPGRVIGARTLVGAGAVVTKHHPADRVLVGVPARHQTIS